MFSKSMKEKYDIVIVPGYPLQNGKWDLLMKSRVYWSKYLYDKGITKNVMYSGSAVATPYKEGEIMALYAEAIGIPKANVYSETKAEHSTENVYYSYKKSKKLGFHKIALASDPFQSKLLSKFIRRYISRKIGVNPFVYDTLKAMQPEMKDPEIDYKKAFVKDFIPLNKREGIWKRYRGTRGHDIDTSAYR
jgi:hypothetical protein